jgi:N-acetylmuramoyl-L-alanine amidase
MAFTKKILTSLMIVLFLSAVSRSSAYASEPDTAGKAVQGAKETVADPSSTDHGLANTTDITQASETRTDLPENNMDLLLQEGYDHDEQGELCYQEPEYDMAEEEAAEVDLEEEIEEKVIEACKEGKDKSKEEKNGAAKKAAYSEKDLRLLTCLVYTEAGSQSYEGMLGIANIVLNRVKSDIYSHVNTIEEVIYDTKWSVQFAVTIKNKKTGLSIMDRALMLYDSRKFTGSNREAQEKAMNKAIKAAKAALEGKNNIGNYLCFQNKSKESSIKSKYPDYKRIGNHIFYRTE